MATYKYCKTCEIGYKSTAENPITNCKSCGRWLDVGEPIEEWNKKSVRIGKVIWRIFDIIIQILDAFLPFLKGA